MSLIFNGFHNFHINIGEPSPLLYIGGGLGALAVIAFIIELALHCESKSDRQRW
jgi:hypothetical protein